MGFIKAEENYYRLTDSATDQSCAANLMWD